MTDEKETSAEIFGYAKMDEKQQAHATQIRTKFAELHDFIQVRVSPGRRWSIVKTDLERACMMAIAALAKD